MESWLGGLASSVCNINGCCSSEKSDQFGRNVPYRAKEGNGPGNLQSAHFSDQCMFYNSDPIGKYSGICLHAAETGDAVLLIASLKLDVHLIKEADSNGNTGLHLAARNGHSNVCEILCQVQ